MLSQAKKKIPLLLPGFESIEMSEECSGPFSDTVNVLFRDFMGIAQQGVKGHLGFLI